MIVLADSDSRWKWGVATARQLLPRAGVSGIICEGPNNPSERQLAEVAPRPDSLRVLPLPRALDAVTREAPAVVIVALPGGSCQAVLQWAAARWPTPGPRPLFITGYVGVVYEKMLDGLLNRAGSDVLLANSPADVNRFTSALTGVGADAAAVTLTKLSFLSGQLYHRDPERPYTLTFAPQPGVPRTLGEREYIVTRLHRYATMHPDHDVLVKLRGTPGEALTHTEHYPFQRLIAKLGDQRPPNLEVVLGSMSETLSVTDLLVTVSSTAAVEAMHRGIPTAILTDFGIRESLGNHFFTGSGCYASFNDLDELAAPQVDPEWAAGHGIGPTSTAAPARERLAELLTLEALPPVAPFYTLATAPEHVRGVLARYDLDELFPTENEADGANVGQILGHVMRLVARRAYRYGVQRVAPGVRKVAGL